MNAVKYINTYIDFKYVEGMVEVHLCMRIYNICLYMHREKQYFYILYIIDNLLLIKLFIICIYPNFNYLGIKISANDQTDVYYLKLIC